MNRISESPDSVLERIPSQPDVSAGSAGSLIRRRAIFAVLCVATFAGSLALMALALSPGGFGVADIALLVMFATTLPWMVVGFWNAVIGFAILRRHADPVAAVVPPAGRVRGYEPVTAKTAILLCIRNESPARVVRNIEPMLGGLVEANVGSYFHLFVLSDTSDEAVAAIEQKEFDALAARWASRLAITYRRRAINTGYKAGNIQDFCERWGRDFEFALTLDTDSFMTAGAVLRLVRIMQADAKLGILQSLVVGLPSTSAFARIFQFGMRLGMRSYTMGSVWWQSDCGPYWGHNALLRLAPFMEHCQLPVMKRGDKAVHILSHDQIEAALMRRAGYDVRVIPQDDESWEENPPTLIEFIRRDLRWCQGNMQYWMFLAFPGLRPVTRYQLTNAILMFLGSPAWIGMLVVPVLMLAMTPNAADVIRPDAGLALFLWVMVMWFMPKIATAADVMMRPALRRAFGGGALFLMNVVIDIAYSILLCPIMWFGHTLFMAGLLFGKEIGWIGQTRDDHAVPWSVAARQFWPHALLGWGAIIVLAATHPVAIPFALYLAAGPALAIPLAVWTARPRIGRNFARIGVGRLPEETTTTPELATLNLPAIGLAQGDGRQRGH